MVGLSPWASAVRPALTLGTPFSQASSTLLRAFSTTIPRHAVAANTRVLSSKDKAAKMKAKRRRKKHAMYKMPDLNAIQQFTLCDAIQYIKAFEVGRPASVPKFDVALRFRTKKDGPVVRNQIKLPHGVKTDIKVCVIVPEDSKQAKQAKQAGATLVGDQSVIDMIKTGNFDFDRCITIPSMLPKIQKEGLPRILGPRGLMPSAKLGTVTENIASSVGNMLGGSTYRERQGVVRMAVGQMAFTPEMLRDNIKAFIQQIKKETSTLADNTGAVKEVFEVVLSSTNSPGFSLNGEFKGPSSKPSNELTIV